MAGNSLLTLLDPEKDLMPTGGYEVAHDLGRWWDAVLRLEETIDFVIPAELEAASLRYLTYVVIVVTIGILLSGKTIERMREYVSWVMIAFLFTFLFAVDA